MPDLKYGNIVAYIAKESLRLGTVVGINKDTCLVKDIDNEEEIKCNYKYLRPLKITTRWLKDNGFNDPENIEDPEKRYIHPDLPIVYCHGTRVLYTLGRRLPIKVIYMHHFQNLVSDLGIEFEAQFKTSHASQVELNISIQDLIGGLAIGKGKDYFDTNQVFGFNGVELKLSPNSPKKAVVSTPRPNPQRWAENIRSWEEGYRGSDNERRTAEKIRSEKADAQDYVSLTIARLPSGLYTINGTNSVKYYRADTDIKLTREEVISFLGNFYSNFRLSVNFKLILRIYGAINIFDFIGDTIVLQKAYLRGMIFDRMTMRDWSDAERPELGNIMSIFYSVANQPRINLQIGRGRNSPILYTNGQFVRKTLQQIVEELPFLRAVQLEEPLVATHYEPWEEVEGDRDIVDDDLFIEDFEEEREADGNPDLPI